MHILKAWILAVGTMGVVGTMSWGCFIVPECTGCSDAPTGGAGGTSGSGGTGGTTTTATRCEVDGDCDEKDENPCTKPVCENEKCSERIDDKIVPPGGTECAVYSCSGGKKQEAFPGEEKGCGTDPTKTKCNGMGKCIGCKEAKDCGENTDCRTWACVEGECNPTDTPKGPLVDEKQTEGDCATRACDGNGTEEKLADAEDPPEDDDVCHEGGCEGTTPVQVIPVGKLCGAPGTCVDFVEKAPDTCDENGVCLTGATTECAPFACDADAGQCKTMCTTGNQDEDCVNGYCDGTACVPTKGNGEPCGAPGECIAEFCADGVCCDAACDTACHSCKLGGAVAGECVNLPKGVVDTCSTNQACNMGGCVTLTGGKKAVGQACTQESDCYNSDGTDNCVNGLCRLTNNIACEPATYWYCSTRFCSDAGVCAPCANDGQCQGGTCDKTGSINRCKLGIGGKCGNDADCATNTTCNLAAGTPGTCQAP